MLYRRKFIVKTILRSSFVNIVTYQFKTLLRIKLLPKSVIKPMFSYFLKYEVSPKMNIKFENTMKFPSGKILLHLVGILLWLLFKFVNSIN